jgi:hypothetical protein
MSNLPGVIPLLFITSKTKGFRVPAPGDSGGLGVRFPKVELPSEHCKSLGSKGSQV